MTTIRSGLPIQPGFVLHFSVPVAWSFPDHPYYEQVLLVLGMLLVSGTRAFAADEPNTERLRERLVRRSMLSLRELLDRQIVEPLTQPRWNPNAAALTGRYGIRVYEDAVDIDLAIQRRLPILLADDDLREVASRVARADERFRMLWLPEFVTSPEFRRGWRPM